MLVNDIHLAELNSPKQKIRARVEIYQGSALTAICNCGDVLREFSLERTGENFFFGFGVCQKLRGTLVDINRNLSLTTEHSIEASFGVESDFAYPFPKFYVQEVKRDEVSNEISFSAYDVLYQAERYTVDDLQLSTAYTLEAVAAACASVLGVPLRFINVNDNVFKTDYPEGANLSGTESVRRVLDAIAEATQTIYYISSDWELVFRRLEQGEAVLNITKDMYVDLKNDGVRRLDNIMHVTELGDNVASVGIGEGVTQYIRNNPFWDLRNDVGTLVENAHNNVAGIEFSQFETNWAGNYLLELGDRISMVTEDDSVIYSYLLDDTITFDGAVMQYTRWSFEDNEGERASNPTTLGDALKDTYAKVDKANKQITLLVNDVSVNKSTIDSELQTIKENQTSFTQTATDITLRVASIEDNGVTRVDTGTGFTFNEEGLRINKDNSGIENLIDNTGMYVKQDGAEVLSANTDGVKAKDLHAVTYLWIGSHSRFEDYEGGRTGCFWISR